MSDMHILTFKHFEVKVQNTGRHVFLGISLIDPDQQPAISISQLLPPEVVARIAVMLESAAREGEGQDE